MKSVLFMTSKDLSPENYKRMLELSMFLRELRINSGYTQERVAKEIKLSRNSISKIERMGFFRIQHLFMLADFYEIPINELFSEIA
jgi:transcriptional regulator with XRE-family HTH domain